jgi:hypothetical protein
MNDMESRYAVVSQSVSAIKAAYDDNIEWVERMTELVREKAGDEIAEKTAAECMHYMMHVMAGACTYVMGQTSDFPVLEKFISYTGKNFATQNADATYHVARLNSEHDYRISGKRGTASLIEFTVYTHETFDTRQKVVSSLALETGEEVDIVLSRSRRAGAWLELPEGPCFVIMRQYFDDWDDDENGRFVIERLDQAYPAPARPVTEEVPDHARMLGDVVRGILSFSYNLKSRQLAGRPNELPPYVFGTADYVRLRYTSGYVICRPDEAALIEFRPPETRYWSINMADVPGNAFHPHLRQCSLNQRQAVVDPDGVCRVVIAHKDPGVANWLDCGGRDLIIVQSRFHEVEEVPDMPVRIVAFDEIDQNLPPETARVTPDERDQIIRRRLRSAYNRGLVDL